MEFKKNNSFDKRKAEAAKIKNSYPDRIPIIAERKKGCSNVPKLDKCKFLVPDDLTIGQFMYVIRKRIKLSPEQGIFLFINNTLPPTSECLLNTYEKLKEQDDFLYITYTGENTFG